MPSTTTAAGTLAPIEHRTEFPPSAFYSRTAFVSAATAGRSTSVAVEVSGVIAVGIPFATTDCCYH